MYYQARISIADHSQLIGELRGEFKRIQSSTAAGCFVWPCVTAGIKDKDGIPIVILEAMAMQLLVVSTPVLRIPEVIETRKRAC